METITLANGVKMPMLGFGTFMLRQDCEQHVLDALKQGCRLIDTAASYFNEEAVGRAVKASGIPREEIFITSKLWVQDAAGKKIVEFGGIMSNPNYAKVQEGAELARDQGVDFILAVGGGSVIDCCKRLSADEIYEILKECM